VRTQNRRAEFQHSCRAAMADQVVMALLAGVSRYQEAIAALQGPLEALLGPLADLPK